MDESISSIENNNVNYQEPDNAVIQIKPKKNWRWRIKRVLLVVIILVVLWWSYYIYSSTNLLKSKDVENPSLAATEQVKSPEYIFCEQSSGTIESIGDTGSWERYLCHLSGWIICDALLYYKWECPTIYNMFTWNLLDTFYSFVETIWKNKPQNKDLSEEKKSLIQQIEWQKWIIENKELNLPDKKIQIERFSSLNYNENKTLWIYTVCSLDDGLDIEKHLPWAVYSNSRTERTLCGVIEYSVREDSNKVLFIWAWWWNGWWSYSPIIKYNFDDDIIIDDSMFFKREFIWDLIYQDELVSTIMINQTTEPYIKWSGWTYVALEFYESIFVTYNKDIKYQNMLDYYGDNYNYIREELIIPYYRLDDDFNYLLSQKEFKENKDEISDDQKKLKEEEIKYLNDINNWPFKISISVDTLDNQNIFSGNVFIINNIIPKSVDFDLYESKNIYHPFYRAIWIKYPSWKWFFIFNIHSLKWARISSKDEFIGRQDLDHIVLWTNIIDLNNLKRQDTVILQ